MIDPIDPMQSPEEENYKYQVIRELSSDADIKEFNKQAKAGNGHVFMLYFADWCGHCKMLKPELIKLDKVLSKNKDKVHNQILMIEESNKDKLDVFNEVSGFPTIVILNENGEKSQEFNEPTRNDKGLLTFLKKHGIVDESVKIKEEASQSGGKKSKKLSKKGKKVTKKSKKNRKTKKTSKKNNKKMRKH